MKTASSGLPALLALAMLVACGSVPGTPPQSSDNAALPPRAEPRRTLVMAIAPEPEALSLEIGSAFSLANPLRLFNASLSLLDEHEAPVPYLAEGLPQVNTETWQVFPDGRMETTYRLRPNLAWHDGAPLSAEDFVFAWNVYRTPEFGVAGRPPQSQMEEVLAPDQRTLVVRWRSLYPRAGIIGSEQSALLPLPQHILGHYGDEGRLAAVANDAYWTRSYIGVGPYRLDRWEAGAFLEAAAFDGHALGRPRIDRVRMVFITDPNTVVAGALSGDVQLADSSAITFETGATLRGAGFHLLLSPNNVGISEVQVRPDVARPSALLDLRVRQALAHAMDRQALNDALFSGEGIVASTMMAPTLGYFPLVDRAILRYDYDLRRAEQLMNEAGFVRGADGMYASPSQGRFTMDSWHASRVVQERELNVMTDAWRRGGFDAQPYVLPPAQILNHELKTTFTGLMTTRGGVDEASLRFLSTSGIPAAENRWSAGINYGGWSDGEYDRLLGTFNRTLGRDERSQLVVQMMKRTSEQVPWIFLYYGLTPTAYHAALQGPQVPTPSRPTTWNVHEWDWR